MWNATRSTGKTVIVAFVIVINASVTVFEMGFGERQRFIKGKKSFPSK